jgi:hypothetical protein
MYPNPFLPLLLFTGFLAASPQEPGTLHGLVLSATSGKPIDAVAVTLSGTSFRAESDGRGRFTFAKVPAGTYLISAEHLGFGRHSATIEIPAGQIVDLTLTLDERAIELDTLNVTVTTRSRWLSMNGFYDRRLEGGLSGSYITRQDIERRNTDMITDLMDDFAGVRVIHAGPGKRTIRFNRLSGTCEPDLYVDGSLYRASSPAMRTSGGLGWDESGNKVDDFNLVSANQIDAVEIYVGAATPVRFSNGNGCGVVLMWLRR